MAEKKNTDRREFDEETYQMLKDIHQVIYGNGNVKKSIIHRLSRIETTITFIVGFASFIGGVIGSAITLFIRGAL